MERSARQVTRQGKGSLRGARRSAVDRKIRWFPPTAGERAAVVSISAGEPANGSEDWLVADSFWSLVLAFVVAAVTLSVLASVLHVFNRHFSFSLLRALGHPWAWISILAMSVLWLGAGLVHQIRSGGTLAGREPANSAGGADPRTSRVLNAANQGRLPSHRPRAYREVCG